MEPQVAYSKPPVYIGIDPGLSGGVAIIVGTTVKLYPFMKLLTSGFIDLMQGVLGYGSEVKCILEKVSAFPAAVEDTTPCPQCGTGVHTMKMIRGATSTWTFAQNYGEIIGVLRALGVPFEERPPKAWQGLVFMKKDRGESQSSWKGRLKDKGRQLYPNVVGLTLPVADALLIAHFCRAYYTGKVDLPPVKELPF